MLPGHLLSAAAATALTPFQANGMPLLLHEKPQGSPGHHLPCPFGGVSLLGHGEGQRPGLLELSSGPLLCHATSEVDALPPAFDAYCPILQVFPLTLSVIGPSSTRCTWCCKMHNVYLHGFLALFVCTAFHLPYAAKHTTHTALLWPRQLK